MALHNLMLNLTSKTSRLNLGRLYSTILERELEVPTFCDLHVDLPYSVKVKPLNVHKYHNCDKLILQFNEECADSLEYDLYGNRITVVDKKGTADRDMVCRIKAPVKANLYITSKQDITIGYFHGDKLHLESAEGHIKVDRYQGDEVDIKTHKGSVKLLGFVQASNVKVAAVHGDITTGRLQSLMTKLETKKGNISVESSYAHESHFNIEKGNLHLNNAHKFCKVYIKDGTMNLTGFDGRLISFVENGSADIHISKLVEDSEINVLNGVVNLKLSEACQDNVKVNIKTKNLKLAENTKFTVEESEGGVVLLPDFNGECILSVNCEEEVKIQSTSWEDMMMLKLKK